MRKHKTNIFCSRRTYVFVHVFLSHLLIFLSFVLEIMWFQWFSISFSLVSSFRPVSPAVGGLWTAFVRPWGLREEDFGSWGFEQERLGALWALTLSDGF